VLFTTFSRVRFFGFALIRRKNSWHKKQRFSTLLGRKMRFRLRIVQPHKILTESEKNLHLLRLFMWLLRGPKITGNYFSGSDSSPEEMCHLRCREVMNLKTIFSHFLKKHTTSISKVAWMRFRVRSELGRLWSSNDHSNPRGWQVSCGVERQPVFFPKFLKGKGRVTHVLYASRFSSQSVSISSRHHILLIK
jgi:hypothetical protein